MSEPLPIPKGLTEMLDMTAEALAAMRVIGYDLGTDDRGAATWVSWDGEKLVYSPIDYDELYAQPAGKQYISGDGGSGV